MFKTDERLEQVSYYCQIYVLGELPYFELLKHIDISRFIKHNLLLLMFIMEMVIDVITRSLNVFSQ